MEDSSSWKTPPHGRLLLMEDSSSWKTPPHILINPVQIPVNINNDKTRHDLQFKYIFNN
jgi:hypothetical protein